MLGLYKSFDKKFDDEDDMEEAIATALGEIAGWVQLHNGPLMKPYQLYSLVLAVAHVRTRLPKLQSIFRLTRATTIDRDKAVQALADLAEAVEREDEDDDEYSEFVLASTSKTNVKKERETRFTWFCRAITGRDA
jgi:hypothetical protein